MRTIASAESFATLPKDYTGLCQRYVPRPLHDAADYAAARQAIEPLLGFEERLTADQVDYLEAVSSFIEAYDRVRVKWPKGTPLDTLKFLLEEHAMSAADLAGFGRRPIHGAEAAAGRTPADGGSYSHAGMALPHRAGSFAVNFGEHAVRRIAFGWESKHGVCRVATRGVRW